MHHRASICLVLALAAGCSPTGTTNPDGGGAVGGGGGTSGPVYVCKTDRPTLLIQVDGAGKETGMTKKCLNAEICLPAAAGPNAVCGTGTEAFCVIDGTNPCGCANPSPTVYGCDPAGSASGPAETKLFPLDGCGFLRETEPPVICQVGDRCWYVWKADGSVDEAAGAHCASSMVDAQRGSAFYAYACDEELYMHATTALEMDCRCNRSNANMQECRPGSDAWGQGLRRGTGPNMHGINFAKWGSGFIHQGELIAPVHYTGGNAGNLKPGAIYAINLTTGDRRVVSGSYLGTNGRVDVGSGYTVMGEALPFIVSVKLGADGMFYAAGSNTLTDVEITRIDPSNGARTLVWRRQNLTDASNAAYPFGQCFDGRVSSAYAGGFQPVQYADRAFALGPNGTFYLGWHNDGVGVVQISADGSTCTHVSRWASNNTTQPLPNIGTGVTPQYGIISGLLYRNGVVYAFTRDTLLAIDATTGNRSTFSNVAGIGGIGEATFFTDETRGLFFACGTDAARKCSVHSLSDGNNAQGLFQVGQSQPVLPGKYPQLQGAKGALDNNNYNGFGAVALDPQDPNILYFVVLSGVVRYEIDTGNSHFMSM